MPHNLHGDVSEEDLALAEELIEMESYFTSGEKKFSNTIIARVLVCLAHDWYSIYNEEKGDELLQKAEKVCPGYFKDQIIEDMKADPDFVLIVKNLASNILSVFKSIAGL